MPKIKTKEEKIAENFFPVDERDLKFTVEKKIKPESGKIIEKTIKIKPKKNYFNKNNQKINDFKPITINLKNGGPELIITEKPQAALKISSALGSFNKKILNGVVYYEVKRDNKEIFVTSAVGHLFTLKQTTPNSDFPSFDIKWVPNFLAKKSDFTQRYYNTILSLAKKSGEITIATDYDIEGEVIGLNIIRYLCGQNDAKRMKFSTLTKDEINNSYENKLNHIDWGQAIAGETRHYLDWFYGINLSKALMNSLKAVGKFKIMSIGRVQGPTLNIIVKKEKKIQEFKPEKYWQIFIKISDGKNQLLLKYQKDIFKKELLENFKVIKGKKSDINIEKYEQKISPNPPFDLTTLQTEAYKHFGISPSETLKIAQSLYLAGMISYPRTSSQKLPASIGYNKILKKLAKEWNVEHLIKKDKPIEGKKSDPAHPSIYPTGEIQIISEQEQKIYSLIVKRFLSLFCEDAIVEKKTVSLEINNMKFFALGSLIKKKAWMEIYPYQTKEQEIPDLKKEVLIEDVLFEEKETQPPKRYTPASIIAEMEKKNLGTKATRSTIVETLYERGYIEGKSIKATPLGIYLISTLEKFSPIIIDEQMTRDFESKMDSIIKSKKNFNEKQEKILKEAKEVLIKIIDNFKKNLKEIGESLLEANIQAIEQKKEENKLITCPKCNKGELLINYSKKNRKYFVSCSAYPDCSNTYSLPPYGMIKKSNQICEFCGYPKLMSIRKSKSPWIFCFNPNCPSNKDRIEKSNNRNQNKTFSQDT